MLKPPRFGGIGPQKRERDLYPGTPLPLSGPTPVMLAHPLPPPPAHDPVQAALPAAPGGIPSYHYRLADAAQALRVIPAPGPEAEPEMLPLAAMFGGGGQSAAAPAAPLLKGVIGQAPPRTEVPPPLTQPALSTVQAVDAYFPFALYLALAGGTLFFLPFELRYSLLWLALAVLGAFFGLTDTAEPPEPVSSAHLGWGFGFGLIIGLPLLLIIGGGLAQVAGQLFPGLEPPALILYLLLAMPLGETFFFRGLIQGRRGLAAGAATAGLSTLLIFWQNLADMPLGLAAFVLLALGGLSALYGYVRQRYSLAAALLCQVTLNSLVLLAPLLLP